MGTQQKIKKDMKTGGDAHQESANKEESVGKAKSTGICPGGSES